MNIFNPENTNDLRCLNCGKLLAKEDVEKSNLEIKCHRCGTLNSIFKYIKDQIIITDPKGNILFANDLLQKVTGYKLEEVVGQNPKIWGGQMSKDFYKDMWQKIKEDKKSIVVKVKNKRKSGELYEALLRISPVFDTKGEIQMYVGMETVINN